VTSRASIAITPGKMGDQDIGFHDPAQPFRERVEECGGLVRSGMPQ
jgi:hypothetical protein